MDIYELLLKDMKNLRKAEEVEASGLDDFLCEDRRKVASLGDLTEFFRISSDTLIHKAKRDLWRIRETKNGEIIIERLFDENKKPIRV